MSDFGSFSDLASVKGNTVEKPKPLPTASYSAMIKGPYKEHKAKSGNLAMRFPVQLVDCLDDEPRAEIAADELKTKAMGRDYSLDFWMSPDARWRFTEFCKSIGIDDSLDLLSMGEELAKCGTVFKVQGTQSPSQSNPDDVYFNIDNPAPLD